MLTTAVEMVKFKMWHAAVIKVIRCNCPMIGRLSDRGWGVIGGLLCQLARGHALHNSCHNSITVARQWHTLHNSVAYYICISIAPTPSNPPPLKKLSQSFGFSSQVFQSSEWSLRDLLGLEVCLAVLAWAVHTLLCMPNLLHFVYMHNAHEQWGR